MTEANKAGGETEEQASSKGANKGTQDDPDRESGEQASAGDPVTKEELARARREAAESRVAAKEAREALAAFKKQLGEALGVGDKKGETDAAGQIAAMRSRLDKAEGLVTFNAVCKACDADPELTLAVLETQDKIQGDWSKEKLTALVREAVKANPKLAETQPTQVGADQHAGNKGKKFSMNAAIRAAAGRTGA